MRFYIDSELLSDEERRALELASTKTDNAEARRAMTEVLHEDARRKRVNQAERKATD